MPTDAMLLAHASMARALSDIRHSPFDLVSRAEIAIAGCTGLTNPDRDGQPYSYAELHTQPPIAMHAPWDYADVSGRLLDALTLARIMTSTHPAGSDEAFARMLKACQREDGLITLPAEAWTGGKPLVEMEWSPRGALMAWTTRYLAQDDQEALQCARKLVHALHKTAVWEGEVCWYPASVLPGQVWAERTPPIGKMRDVLIGAQIVYPLARFAGATGSEEASKLAHGLIRFLKERSGAFLPDGKFTEKTGRSFHSITGFILGTLKYGMVAGKDNLVEWAQAAYVHAKEWGTDFGFFPHGVSGKERWQGNVCATTDMIECAILLGLHKSPRYFEDAERFGRNHLLESQLLDYKWIETSADVEFCPEMWCSNYTSEGVTVDDVCIRTVGGFAGWSRVNDAFDPANPRLLQRCSGSGTRALYDLWHFAVTRSEAAVHVNLHFSRDTRNATVTSLLPFEGGVEVLMKNRGCLAVRVPSGVNNAEVEVMVNETRPRHEILRGNYAWLEALQNGDVVVVKWPLRKEEKTYQINDVAHTGQWHGDTLLSLHPRGTLSPMYGRSHETACAPARTASGPVKEIDPI